MSENNPRRIDFLRATNSHSVLRDIILRYKDQIRVSRKDDGEFHLTTPGKVEFPLALAQEVHRRGDLRGKHQYPILGDYELPTNFGLVDLTSYFYELPSIKDVIPWFVEKVENVEVSGGQVYLDVKMGMPC